MSKVLHTASEFVIPDGYAIIYNPEAATLDEYSNYHVIICFKCGIVAHGHMTQTNHVKQFCLDVFDGGPQIFFNAFGVKALIVDDPDFDFHVDAQFKHS